MDLNKDQLRGLAGAVVATRPEEIGCDEWLDRVAGYLELVLAGEPVPESLRLVHEHLGLCPECREEFEAMKAAVRGG